MNNGRQVDAIANARRRGTVALQICVVPLDVDSNTTLEE